MCRHLQSNWIAIELVQLDDETFDQEIPCVADHILRQRVSFEALLVHEVETIGIAVQIRRWDHFEIRFFELVAGFERLVKDGPGQKVSHLQANQSLSTSGCGGGHLSIETVEWCIFELEKHLALDVDGIDQCGHVSLNQ